MSERSTELLDFPRIAGILAGFCRTPMGRERALALRPRAEPGWVAAEYDRVDELLALEEEPGLAGVADIRPVLARARQEARLTGPELLAVRRTAAGIRELRQFLGRSRERLPAVWPRAGAMVEAGELERSIDVALDEHGEVRDSASPGLAKVRQEMRRRRNRLVERLEEMVARSPELYADRPTVRHDRFVLPLRLEMRDRLAGVIHESSGTGHTLFVEPLETVSEQNELAELRDAEAEEVGRVLKALSEAVAERSAELGVSLEVAAELDLLFAKRRFALEFDASRPEISTDGRVEIAGGRHPLLEQRGRPVVPLDFRLPGRTPVVLISGPNAGGKTVALKTLGLFSLMAAAGIHLPAGRGTRLPLFSRVFADIGDEQSLDTDLSSFTAHVARLRQIHEHADAESLVLLDEVGSSTAPEEGAALAIAVLETFRDRGTATVATSHFGVLKLFVQDEPGMANAAMGFRDGSPTYKLAFGFPGESSALEIAAAAGLCPEVIERAKSRLGQEWLDLSAKLRSIEAELEEARSRHRAAEVEEQRAAVLRAEYEERLGELKDRAREERDQLRNERERLLLEARRQIENLVREIRESQAGRQAIVKAKQAVDAALRDVERPPARPESPGPSLAPGMTVESRTFRRCGLVTAVEHGEVTVAFGRVRMKTGPEDLTVVDAEPAARTATIEEPPQFEPKLSIRGMARDEASDAVDRFIDEAVCFGVGQVSIVHGRGTGVLQRMLRAQLRRDSRVQSFRFGESYEGGDGVTFVTLGTKEDDKD